MKHELLAELLQSSKGEARKTASMHRANFGFQPLNKCLSVLVNNGFLEGREGNFLPSQRGLLHLYRFARHLTDMLRSEKVLSIHPSVAKAEAGR
jgi:predicted transcriptional regulator